MEKYNVTGDYKQPNVNLDAEKGLIEISGRSIPEQTAEFYKPIIEWVETYAQNSANETTINYHLEYYNSSSKRYLLDILEMLSPLHKSDKKLTFNWYYEEDDDEAEDAGILYGELAGFPVNLIPMPE